MTEVHFSLFIWCPLVTLANCKTMCLTSLRKHQEMPFLSINTCMGLSDSYVRLVPLPECDMILAARYSFKENETAGELPAI